MRIKSLIIYLLLGPFILLNAAEESGNKEISRYGLFIGSNFGGKQTENLKYAKNDALSISRVFKKIGGIPDENQLVLLNPDVQGFEHGFSYIESLLNRDSKINNKTEFVFYYSGHSNDRGLMLFGKEISYVYLKEKLESLATNVNLAILDSCYSGSFARIKGGVIKSPFIFDNSNLTEGSVILTSSSENEESQESDLLQGSFFTHSVLKGLRGAADKNGDSVITLNELYDYSFNETLLKTEETMAGHQHPSYKIDLKGSGEFVLTDLRKTNSKVIIPKDMKGKITLRDMEDNLFLKLIKTRRIWSYGWIPVLIELSIQ